MPDPPGPRVPPLPESQWTGAHQDRVARFAPDARADPLLAALLHVPEMVDAIMPMTAYITGASELSPSHRLLLAQRTVWRERSNGLWATDLDRRIQVRDDAPNGDDVGPFLLRLVDELALNVSVTDTTWAGLSGSHDVRWMMDAVETVAHIAFLCCLARSFGVHQGGPLSSPDRQNVPPPGPPLPVARIEPVEGDAIAVLRTFARHPAMATARRPRSDFVNRVSRLTPHDRETLILRIGWDAQSEYEWAKHVGSVGRAREHGVDPDVIASGPSAAAVSDHDALLMRMADDLHEDAMVSDATWGALLEDHDLPWMMSAVFTASSYRSTCMSLKSYGVQLEPGDERFPQPR